MGQECNQDGSCRSGCVQGFFGLYCNSTCSDNCNICHPITGKCLDKLNICNKLTQCNFTTNTCFQGKYGFNCEYNCSSGCKNDSSIGYLCEKFTGACINNCNYGHFGDRCEQTCGKCALNNNSKQACDPSSGECRSCLKTYHGDQCLQSCNRTCLDSDCRMDGVCSYGCMDGWLGLYCEGKWKRQ